jgi:RNA polymerase sigma factor (sigma-70 family)
MTPGEFEAVFKEHGPLVWSLIGKYHFSVPDAEDLFMEIWEAVWKALPGFLGKSRLSTWIGGIARNKCADRLERKKADSLFVSRISEEEGDRTEIAPGGAGDSPREKAIRNELKAEIGKALRKLSPVQNIIVKRWMMGFKYREIAEMLTAAGIRSSDENYVGKQLFLARTKIAAFLKREEAE